MKEVSRESVIQNVNEEKATVHYAWLHNEISDETYKRKLKALDDRLDLVKTK